MSVPSFHHPWVLDIAAFDQDFQGAAQVALVAFERVLGGQAVDALQTVGLDVVGDLVGVEGGGGVGPRAVERAAGRCASMVRIWGRRSEDTETEGTI